MPNQDQPALFETAFETAKPANLVYCHQEFLEKLAEHGRDPIAKRTSLLLQRLAVDSQRLHYKATYGPNRGWRRSRLGGSHGSHYYAWWTTQGSPPIKEAAAFGNPPEGALFLRDIRHHDDHSPLDPQGFEAHYLPITVPEIRREEYSPAPWTTAQSRFAAGRQPVRILKGHPGSGKTTALWNAADASGARRVLYVTYSRDLAALAKDYFDRFCSVERQFHVVTYSALLRELLSVDTPVVGENESRQQFIRDLGPFARMLGPWSGHQAALYDEWHAHLIGDALPTAAGRFAACPQPRVADKAFKDRRTKSIGPTAAAAALDVAARMEKDAGSLAAKYFPELALAWKAAQRLTPATGEPHVNKALLEFDCLAVDEIQDLTPVEAFVLVQLAGAMNRGRRVPVPVLLAGDEAQTVRPTDFEWAWLNDMLHSTVGTPAEFKLAVNLRSPRRIAELVNRVWDLYRHIDKGERPSGSGYAEIDDDANDQVLHCTAVPGPELDELLTAMAAREGLALIHLDETVPAYVPDALKPAVLSAREAKGLDFHSVCVLEPGRHLEKIARDTDRLSIAEIEDLRKRLAIDQLRVALSRPAERLIWLDTNPSEAVLEHSSRFLNGNKLSAERTVMNSVPAALLRTLEEDQLDLEERIQRCQQDARQYLNVRPEMAWSRAQQAVALLGDPGTQTAVEDKAVQRAAYLTLAEVCFTLGFRKARLAPELGRLRLFEDASHAAARADEPGLSAILSAIGNVQNSSAAERLPSLLFFAHRVGSRKADLAPWLMVEVGPKIVSWVDELEAALHNGHNAAVLIQKLPPLYEALGLVDRGARLEKLNKRAIQLLLKDKQFREALSALQAMPERQPKLEAECYEGLGDHRRAAECHREAGGLKEALACYRSIPDVTEALKVIKEMGDHPAAESLQWMARLDKLVKERPAAFPKSVTAAEKKHLEQLLEQSLGVARKKPQKAVAKKVAAKKAAATKSKYREPF